MLAVELNDASHAAAQKETDLAVKQKVLRRVSNQLGASRIFTCEHIDELAPVDEQMSEKEKKAMTEGVKIELEHESQASTPMEVDIDAPRKRQAEERQSCRCHP